MIKSTFTTKNVAGMAVFVALAYVISYLEFPLFAAVPFLKLDFSNVFIMLGGFMYGPLPAILIGLAKEFLCFLTKSTTGGVGEIANFCMILSYVLLPSIVYLYKKGIKSVVLSLVVASILQPITSLVCNRFINFPLYGMTALFAQVWHFILFFNVIKSVAISIVTMLLYKRVSYLFKRISLKTASDDVSKNNKIYDFSLPYESKNADDTMAFASAYAKTLTLGTVIILSGDLGAGKTTFVKGLAKGFDIEDEVTSPTYAYLNVYGDKVYHYDCYRLSDGESAESLGLTDYFNGDNICVIEWAENIVDVLPKTLIKIEITKLKKNKRHIKIINDWSFFEEDGSVKVYQKY